MAESRKGRKKTRHARREPRSKQPSVQWYYLHTINGQPAYFAGDQLVYAGGRWPRRPQPLVASLAQIRRERMASHIWRLTKGFRSDITRYGYVRVSLPDTRTPLRRLPHNPKEK